MITKLLKNTFRKFPKVGDKVRVGIGFYCSTIKEGVVSRVIENDTDSYCWIDEFDSKGNYKSSFTASFSYAKFEYL